MASVNWHAHVWRERRHPPKFSRDAQRSADLTHVEQPYRRAGAVRGM